MAEAKTACGIKYSLTRSNRSSIEVRIKDGNVAVRCPRNMPVCDIESFLEKKRGWIDRHLRQQLEDMPEPRQYIEGEGFPLLGSEYPIYFADAIGFDGSRINIRPADDSAEHVRQAISDFYQRFAVEYIPRRVQHYAIILDVDISRIRIREYSSQWGSCGAKNQLSFNTRLVLYSPEAIDYVVVHELAHIRQRNHSPAFWEIVGGVFPNYKQLRAQLSHNKVY